MSQELGKSNIFVDFKDGKASISALEGGIELVVKVSALVNPALDAFSAKVESGEIDLIKNTDLDKTVLLQAVAFIKAELNK